MYHEQYNNELSIFNRQNFYNKLIQNTKYKIQNTKIQNTKYKIQNTKYKIQNQIGNGSNIFLLIILLAS